MNHWFEHHGDNRRYKGHVAITTIRRSGLVLDMVDTIRTQTLIGYYENISRTKSAVKTSTRTKHTRIVSN